MHFYKKKMNSKQKKKWRKNKNQRNIWIHYLFLYKKEPRTLTTQVKEDIIFVNSDGHESKNWET